MENRQPEDRPGRHFYFTKEATYIEKQEITVQSGAYFYNGPGPDDDAKPGISPVLETKTELPKEEEVTAPELSRIERIVRGIKLVRESGIVQNDYEYVAIRFVILEKKILPILSLVDYERLLLDSQLFNDGSLPKANNMKLYSLKGKFPDWIVVDKKYDVTVQFVKVARKFLEGYNM